jgi:5-methylcytosine-specific restriction endonuclease McrA
MPKETQKYKDRAKYLAAAVSKRRKHLKVLAVQLGGGKCQICGYDKYTGALEFHHLKENSKLFQLSVRDLTKSWKLIKKEIKKCILVCSNCHREIHGRIISLPQK